MIWWAPGTRCGLGPSHNHSACCKGGESGCLTGLESEDPSAPMVDKGDVLLQGGYWAQLSAKIKRRPVEGAGGPYSC